MRASERVATGASFNPTGGNQHDKEVNEGGLTVDGL